MNSTRASLQRDLSALPIYHSHLPFDELYYLRYVLIVVCFYIPQHAISELARRSAGVVPAYAPIRRLAKRRSALTCTFAPFPFLVVTTDSIIPSQPQILSQRALEKQPVRDRDIDPVAIEDSQLQHLAPALQPQDTPPAAQSPPSITHIENQSSRRRSFLEALLARQHRPALRRNNRAATQRVLNPINYVPRPTPVPIDRQTHLPPGAEPGTAEVHTLLTLPEQRRSRRYSQEGDIVEHSPQLSSAAGSRTSIGLPPNQRRTSGLGGSRSNLPTMADEKPNEPEKAHLTGGRYDDPEGQQTQSAAPSRLASQYGMSPHDQPSQPPRRVSSLRSLRHFRSQNSLRSHVSRTNTNTNLEDAPPMPPAPQTTGYPSADDGDVAEELSWGPSHPCYPHLNPHVPMASPDYTTTRIIRIKRDWMVVGDLAPAFSNIYPEILDPLMSEQEFRYIVRHINATLIQAFDPYSTYNWLDGFLGFITGWFWEGLRPTGVKGQLRELEAWIEAWNREQGRREGIRLISLRRTGYMNLDIQIPDPQVRVVADDEPGDNRGPPTAR